VSDKRHCDGSGCERTSDLPVGCWITLFVPFASPETLHFCSGTCLSKFASEMCPSKEVFERQCASCGDTTLDGLLCRNCLDVVTGRRNVPPMPHKPNCHRSANAKGKNRG
jgi:hypothetical protein